MASDGRGALGRIDWLIVVAAVTLYVAARLWRLGESCLWFDELFGVQAARYGWGALARFVALDLVHPPLFYLLLKVWISVGGESVWWLRLFPALAAALAVVPLALLWRELRLGARTLQLALLLAAASGFLIKYAQEVRMYAPLLLFASCSLWLFARFCRAAQRGARLDGGADDGRATRLSDGRRATRRADGRGETRRAARLSLFALTAANLLLVYTHYFGWLLVALEMIFLLAWRRGRLKSFAASVALVAVCFAPWAWAVLDAAGAAGGGGLAQNIGWAARPRAPEIFQPYLLLHEPFRFQRHSHEPAVLRFSVVMTLLVFAPPLAALGWHAVRRARKRVGPRAGEDGDSHERDRDAGDNFALRDAGNNPSLRDMGDDFALRDAGDGFALRFLSFFSAAPVAAAFLAAQALPHSVWGTRHLAVVAPAYLLLAAHALCVLRPRWLSLAAQSLLGCWLLLACAGWLTRRHEPAVWCSWETLSARLARAESAGTKPVRVYAHEELAAYHVWHALGRGGVGGGGAEFRVAVVKNIPGLEEDRAFFLPRGFDDISVADADAAFKEDDFWLAFRAARWRDDHPLVAALAARGYEIAERFESSAQGQTTFMARARKR